MVKTKIIATLGPASGSLAMLRKMFRSGLDLARLNFSHGSHKEHISRIEAVRQLNKKMRRAIKIMQDLEGYRLRIGKIARSQINLKKNTFLQLTQRQILGSCAVVSFDYFGRLSVIKKGALLFIDDGRIALEVVKVGKSSLKTKVLTSGVLKEHKGINIPKVKLQFPALTAKDKFDLNIAIKYKLDYLAQSFVRDAKDVKLLKKILKAKHPKCKVFAKIENSQAINNINAIIKAADGILIARGDLGVNLPIHKVPTIQKDIIKLCGKASKPVVVATQMLESMTENAIPTRAEVSDVTNAILDGTDFVMLSGETAVGKYPDKTVEMMNKIIKNTEEYQSRGGSLVSRRSRG